ncbi:MAG: glycosyltransferase family 39 protein [Oscillospiraceae bacterium]|nr:glycosyltransferase family 39 protein [Oscillospiraceae bacterium]
MKTKCKILGKEYDVYYLFLFCYILVIGFAVRLVGFGGHPAGLNQDEASIGYETYALLKAGIDRNGCSFPVHFIAWGSGQNALYAYFSMPFVAIMGLNVVSVRMVNLIFSLLSILAVHSVFRRHYDEKMALIAMALTAISPWNIMLSRWSLESNLFPSMLILSLWAISKSLTNRRFLYLAAVLLALSMYAYGAAYLVVPVMLLELGITYVITYARNRSLSEELTVREQFPVRSMIGPVIVFLVVALPMFLFMYINVFDHETIQLGPITIPHTYGGRLETSSGATLKSAIRNFFGLCVMQNDNLSWNGFQFYGCDYVISLPFTVIGILCAVRSHKPMDVILLIMLSSALLLFAYYEAPNINRVNAVYFPLLLLAAIGIHALSSDRRYVIGIFAAYAICFCGFMGRYFGREYKDQIGRTFFESYGEAITYADSIHEEERIIVTAEVNMPYIFALFYTRNDPHEFIDTVEYANPGGQFQYVKSYGDFVFDHELLTSGEKGIYIIANDDLETMRQYTSEIQEYRYYSVAVVR